MTTETKLEFASTAWIDAIRAAITAELAAEGDAARSINFSVSELYTDTPVHISPDGQVGWSCRIADGQVAFQHARDPDADIVMVGEYAAIQQLARIVVAGDPDRQAELERMMAEALESGRMRIDGDVTRAPPAMNAVHDDVASRTA